ncbi:MAG: energy transducer TonB [Candidatus Margulisbacteria bacterium]|nr:energy transducer TonB [Candidatus Margulisiibacteriota bacterium]
MLQHCSRSQEEDSMTFSDKGIDRISLSVSLILHILILFLSFPYFATPLVSKEVQYQIPVELAISTVQPTPKKAPKKVAKKIPKSVKTVASAPKPKPTSLPGDRKKPAIKGTHTPTYPKTALNHEWSGTVVAEVTVNSDGIVTSIAILKSTGHTVLDEAFKRSLNRYTFLPKREMGKNKVGKTRVRYTFKLEG